LKDETIDRTRWRARFGRSYGPVLRQEYGMDKRYELQVSRQVLNEICNIRFQENLSCVSRTDAGDWQTAKET
jgi:hypothetical protein